MQSGEQAEGRQTNEMLCPIVESVKTIGGIWNLIIIRYLSERPMGFNELLRNVQGLNSKTLSRVLKNLQKNSIISREVLSTQPFSVQYSLTDKGAALGPVLQSLKNWGEKWALPIEHPSTS